MRSFREKLLVQAGKSLLERSREVGDFVHYDSQSPVSYVLGSTALRNVLRNGNAPITKLYVVSHEHTEKHQEEALALAREQGITIEHDRRYAFVWGFKSKFTVVGELQKWDDRIEPGSHVVLVNPHLPANTAAIMRTALAFGIRNLAVIAQDFDSFHPSVLRSSMGARLDLHVEAFPDVQQYFDRFPENHRYAFMLDAAKPLAKVKKRAPYSLVFGNETYGLPPEYAKTCKPVFIEQSDLVDSLNVSVSAAVAMREFALATGAI